METVQAQVIDSSLLRLEHPIGFPPGSKVLITILDVEDDWFQFSLRGLNYAFSDDEPEYPLHKIKEANPEYRP